MLKSYHWIVAGIFITLSLFMLKAPISFSKPILEKSPQVESLGIEEQEIIYSTLNRIEEKKHFSSSITKLNEVIAKQTLPILVAHSNQAKQVFFQEGLGLVFSENFFKADPISQEISMSELLTQIAQSGFSNNGSLAKIQGPKK
jgi:hypothetical protein